ncbi:MAG: C25 family cysteine peptidase, partial [Saprospiraceae bacterium]
MSRYAFLLCVLSPVQTLQAQMWNGADTLYGNEWIRFDQSYCKISIAADGIYRISAQSLESAGVPVAAVPASQYRLFHHGRETPIWTSVAGPLGPQDYLEFFGAQNRDALDRALSNDPDNALINPRFSLFNDRSAYYLCWAPDTAPPLRIRSITFDLANPPAPEPFCWFEIEQIYTDTHRKRRISSEITFSWFDGNGFCRSATTTTHNFSPRQVFQGPPALLRLRYACDLGPHRQQFFARDSLLGDESFSGWKIIDRAYALPTDFLSNPLPLRLQSALGGSDQHWLAGFKLRYPRRLIFDQAGKVFFELDATGAEQYLEIRQFQVGSGAVLYDIDRAERYLPVLDNGCWKLRLPAAAGKRRLALIAGAQILSVAVENSRQFRDFRHIDARFVILSNAALFSDPEAGGVNHIQAYADYRRSPAGGGYSVAVADVQELYEQFGYGVRFHPIALRNFCHFIKKNWANPEYLLFIGKGLEYPNFRTAAAQNNLADSLFFVPMFGTPGTDLPFVTAPGQLDAPILAVGRLAVTRPGQIRDYLDKLIEHERQRDQQAQTLPDRAWMKRVLQLSGGLAGETQVIRDYCAELAAELRANRFGADVRTFYKTSKDPIQVSAYNLIRDVLNGGVSIWMFFGHSSATAIDFDIGAVTMYNNAERYPLMMILGCYAGLCSNHQPGLGEQFVLAPDRGAIAYAASVHFGLPESLYQFGRRYCVQIGGPLYGAGVGDALRSTAAAFAGVQHHGLQAVLHQTVLQGDPAVRLHPHPGPDYLVDAPSVQCTPNPVGLDQDSFELQFDLVNIGENKPGLLSYVIEQRLPDNTLLLLKKDTIPAPSFRQTEQHRFYTGPAQAGFNRFFIRLDPDNQMPESPPAAELNNILLDSDGQQGVEVFFFADDVQPLHPSPFGIVGNALFRLSASSLRMHDTPVRYLMEIDTTASFNSPLRQQTQFYQPGGLLQWTPLIPALDSTVYFWRVARDSLVNGKVLWRDRSFIYLQGSTPGWNQSQIGQFRQNRFINLQLDSLHRRFEFADNASFVWSKVAWRDAPGGRYPGLQNALLQGSTGDYGWGVEGIARGVVLLLADPKTGQVIPNPSGGPYNPDTTKSKWYYWFDTRQEAQRAALKDIVQNVIPAGTPVALLAFNRPSDSVGYAPHRWAGDSLVHGKNLFQVFENQGAEEIRALADFPLAPRPYGLVFSKNDRNFLRPADTTVYHVDSSVVVRGDFFTKWSDGLCESPLIGPARNWKKLVWQRGEATDPGESADIGLYVLREGLPDSRLVFLVQAGERALAAYAAEEFPFLRLHYIARDTVARSAAQLHHWRVLFDPLPEGALAPAPARDTVQRGEIFQADMSFVNVSDAHFDSLLVHIRLEKQLAPPVLRTQRLPP